MESNLPHDICEILRQLLLDLGAGSDPGDEDTVSTRVWPVHCKSEPDAPDNCITVYTTSGQDDGQSVHDGALWVHHGWQLRVRGRTYADGYQKINRIRNLLAAVYWVNVSIPDVTGTGDTDYRVETLTGIGTPLPLGKEPATGRYVFTLNGMMTVDPGA